MSALTPFHEVYSLYHRRVRDYARTLVDDPNEAEDVMQDTFLSAFEHYSQLRDRDRLESWLFQIARNRARMNHRRSVSRPLEYGLDCEPISAAADLERAVCCRDRLRRVMESLRKLPWTFKQVVRLRVFQERTSLEASVVMGVSEDVVRTRLHRARLALRRASGTAGVAVMLGYAAMAQSPRHMAPRACSLCHSQSEHMPYGLWSGSMMANASRDPYWMARIEEEKRQHPNESAALDELCTRCHAPMQAAGLKKDGVGCTVCHQIEQEGLGTEASFTGKFVLGIKDHIYGPHANPFTMPMLHHTGYTATESKHIRDSALCATCHTVITHGGFVEQGPFLEWKNSSYAQAGIGCADCHMSALADASGKERAEYIAHRPPGGPFPPTRPRAPVGQHLLIGGNVAIARLLGNEKTAHRAQEMLEQAASIEMKASPEGILAIMVRNLAGHKLPSGYPSRRMWLHVIVRGTDGGIVKESGNWNRQTGELEGAAPLRLYETRMADARGAETFSLLSARTYLADTRIPVDGEDSVTYALSRGAAEAVVELVYQSVSPRHAAGLQGGRDVAVVATAAQKVRAHAPQAARAARTVRAREQ